MLALYRDALRLRRSLPALGDGPMHWLPAEPGVLAFARGDGFVCVVNLSDRPVALPRDRTPLLTSDPLVDSALPPDAAAWLVSPRSDR
jgi:alpha-glucosidase